MGRSAGASLAAGSGGGSAKGRGCPRYFVAILLAWCAGAARRRRPEGAMDAGAAERYLAELRRITTELAGGQRLNEVLEAMTRGLRRSGRLTSVSVALMLQDRECPVCQLTPPAVPSGEKRLHRVAFDAEGGRPAPPVFHVTAQGALFSGLVARDRRLLLVEDVLGRLRAGSGTYGITGEDA